MSQGLATTLGVLILAIPLLGSVLCGVLGPRLGRRFVNLVGPGAVLASFVVALVVLSQILGADESHRSTTVQLWNWLSLSPQYAVPGSPAVLTGLNVGVDVTFDQLSTVMILVITGVGFLIHVYSVGYMEHDRSPWRFFSYMNLFIFSMLTLVLAADLAILIIGWALVALASYLLIGYYYDRPSAVLAARKAFITQVIGDVALIIAAFLIVLNLRDGQGHGVFSLSLPTIFANAQNSFSSGSFLITGICLLLAVGAFAKSAQFPLHTWLPDAMEGPTPVSALIHAATMVTAGVYLIARFHTLFDLAPVAQGVVACVGMGTAVMAGLIAPSQIDIKRVIAFSTMSQIGLMIFAVGIGAYSAGMFHFATHAIFKALLFMAAGNVIHALNDEQDIRMMGDLKRQLKITTQCFLIGSLALAGLFPFAGYFSKEDILGFGSSYGPAHPALYVLGVLVNVLTGLYTFRLYFLVFHGEAATVRVYQAHEPPRTMLYPVVALAAGSIVAGFLLYMTAIPGVFGLPVLANFLDPVFAANGTLLLDPGGGTAALTAIVGLLASFFGCGMAYQWYYARQPDIQVVARRIPRTLGQLSLHRFYFDEIYDAALVRPTRSLARTLRRIVEPRYIDGAIRGLTTFLGDVSVDFRQTQTGFVRDYAMIMLGATTVGVGVVVFAVAR